MLWLDTALIAIYNDLLEKLRKGGESFNGW